MTSTSTTKSCVACGKALNGQKRMKDSKGQYWCIECGTEDQRKKLMSSGGGSSCSSCGENYPDYQLSKFGGQRLCTKCVAARNKGPGLMTTVKGLFSGGGGDTGKLYKLIALAILMILLTIWRYATL